MIAESSAEHRGCRLAFTVDGSGPPVVLVQGVGVAGSGWTPQVEGLRAEFRCLTFDNRGMGASQPAGAAITVRQMAEDTLWLGRSLAGAIPGARFVEFDDASHGLPIQHAARVNALLSEHLHHAGSARADEGTG